MGMMIFYPLILLIAAVAFLSPLIGALCVIAAVLSALVLFIPARRMARAERNWLRAVGAVLIVISAIATLAFACVAVIAIAIAVEFYA